MNKGDKIKILSEYISDIKNKKEIVSRDVHIKSQEIIAEAIYQLYDQGLLK
jgi:hypothetical protein